LASTLRRPWSSRRTATMPARTLEAEASEQQLGRQVFWLTARSGPERPSRGRLPKETVAVALACSGAWPITAAAPRRLRTGFPFVPCFPAGSGNLSRRRGGIGSSSETSSGLAEVSVRRLPARSRLRDLPRWLSGPPPFLDILFASSPQTPQRDHTTRCPTCSGPTGCGAAASEAVRAGRPHGRPGRQGQGSGVAADGSLPVEPNSLCSISRFGIPVVSPPRERPGAA
jgi:hypothetical protein